jgi:Tfp pilus assembly protein FimT
MKLRPRSAAGFTLLEIILAVGIGVIFMGGAVVFLSTTGGDRELIQSRKMLEEAVGEAREKALASGRSQRIVVDAASINGRPIPPEVEMSISVAARKVWTQYEKGYEWLITGGGLVEPIRVRLRHGENQDEFEFNALTGESVTRRQEKR